MTTKPRALRMAKYRGILEEVRSEIKSGKYDTGRRLPSEAELVKRFGVSRPTVARALRELQIEGFVDRRAGSGTYIKPEMVREAGLIGLIVPALGNTEIFDPICAEIARVAHESNFTLLWGGSWPQDTTSRLHMAEELCDRYIRQNVSGVFFAPVELTPQNVEVNRRIASALESAKIPLVLLDRDLCPFPERSNFDMVGIDNFLAGYRLANHLIQLGCKQISFLARPFSALTVDLRIAGWREAMSRADLDCQANRVHHGDPTDEKFVRKVLEHPRAEAIICANDMTAAELMQTLNRMEIDVPRDIRLVGFDDIKYATLLSVPLTTMHQPCRAIGDAAMDVIRDRIKNPAMARREILLDAELVVRKSCGTGLQPDSGSASTPPRRALARH